jgi:hypothetical protein
MFYVYTHTHTHTHTHKGMVSNWMTDYEQKNALRNVLGIQNIADGTPYTIPNKPCTLH